MLKFCHSCTSLTSANFTNMRTLNVTNYDAMFYDYRNLTSLELASFKTRNIDNMLNYCTNLRYIDIQSINFQSRYESEYSSIGHNFSNNGIIKIKSDCISTIQIYYQIGV